MTRPSKPAGQNAWLYLAVITSILFVVTIFVGARKASFVLHASRATATFDGAVAHSGGNHGGTFLYPRFNFVTSDGRNVEMTSKFGSTDQPYDNGQKALVLYDLQKPTEAVLNHFWILWGPTVALAFTTLLFVAITGSIWWLQHS